MCSTPFFPRILKHFISFHNTIKEGISRLSVGHMLLKSVATLQQTRPVNLQFFRQMARRHTLRNSLQDADDDRAWMMSPLPNHSSECVENSTTGTPVVQERRAVSPMNLDRVQGCLAFRALQALRVQDLHEVVVAFFLIHQVGNRKRNYSVPFQKQPGHESLCQGFAPNPTRTPSWTCQGASPLDPDSLAGDE
ncbi:MAG: hypothetical protein HQL63_01900 [Magnetococcales bacterium]|nr:hypothetical protein [Magnetococcales bacterium]